MKLLILEIDALEHSLADKEIPFLSGLQKYYSQIESSSDKFWTNFHTGTKPDEHGIFGELKRNWPKKSNWDSDCILCPDKLMWNVFNRSGLRVGIIDLFYTWPIKQIDGFCIAGIPTPNMTRIECFPNEVVEIFPGIQYWKNPRYSLPKIRWTDLKLLNKVPKDYGNEMSNQWFYYTQLLASQIPLACQKFNIDVLMFYTLNLDMLGHIGFASSELVSMRQAYRNLNTLLVKLSETLLPDLFIIISDHGMSRYKSPPQNSVRRWKTIKDGNQDIILHECMSDNMICSGEHSSPGVIYSNQSLGLKELPETNDVTCLYTKILEINNCV